MQRKSILSKPHLFSASQIWWVQLELMDIKRTSFQTVEAFLQKFRPTTGPNSINVGSLLIYRLQVFTRNLSSHQVVHTRQCHCNVVLESLLLLSSYMKKLLRATAFQHALCAARYQAAHASQAKDYHEKVLTPVTKLWHICNKSIGHTQSCISTLCLQRLIASNLACSALNNDNHTYNRCQHQR